jgi:hypothetical protein
VKISAISVSRNTLSSKLLAPTKPMLRIFASIRRSFFLPGKVRTYLAYAFGEITLIVLGIMIKFKQALNEVLRKGLAEANQLQKTKAYKTKPKKVGLRPGMSYDNVGELLEQVEGPVYK